ncbi:hypothetical protein [Acuticoccus sp. I52.16.1]|uniref:hypothetical protein n=1 Tax=Acuticoccus sp. I52.16.1 TaxID=2928472 RepID=UPI001FCFC59E|nr:hypothetical protein [Acuticoccus sp. I52.16.1]UOM36440.1 hypothetical protein MRB58_09725 [Acuticoccus sp. I52.16.1]
MSPLKYLILIVFVAGLWSPAHAVNDTRIRAAVSGLKFDLEELGQQPQMPFAIIEGIGRRMTRLSLSSFSSYLTVITRSFNPPRDIFVNPNVNIFTFLRTLPTAQNNLLSSNLFGLGAGVDTRQENAAVRQRLALILKNNGANRTRIRAVLRRIRFQQNTVFSPPPVVSGN